MVISISIKFKYLTRMLLVDNIVKCHTTNVKSFNPRLHKKKYRNNKQDASRSNHYCGGIIGCITAVKLLRAGASVLVIDSREVMREASWAAGGILSALGPDENHNIDIASYQKYLELAEIIANPEDSQWLQYGNLYRCEKNQTFASVKKTMPHISLWQSQSSKPKKTIAQIFDGTRRSARRAHSTLLESQVECDDSRFNKYQADGR